MDSHNAAKWAESQGFGIFVSKKTVEEAYAAHLRILQKRNPTPALWGHIQTKERS